MGIQQPRHPLVAVFRTRPGSFRQTDDDPTFVLTFRDVTISSQVRPRPTVCSSAEAISGSWSINPVCGVVKQRMQEFGGLSFLCGWGKRKTHGQLQCAFWCELAFARRTQRCVAINACIFLRCVHQRLCYRNSRPSQLLCESIKILLK
jgi:hypothetical protein